MTLHGADIDYWRGRASNVLRGLPHLRVNGVELMHHGGSNFDEGSATFTPLEFGPSPSKVQPLTVNLRHILVRSLRITPGEPGPYVDEGATDYTGRHGADIDMWNLPIDNGGLPYMHASRPCRIRLNGVELVTADSPDPFMRVREFGSKTTPLVADIFGVIVRNLRVCQLDPEKDGTDEL